MTTQLIPGLYGKLPALGDFVTRSLPADFICLWDDWIQRAIRASREQMGDKWLECYLTCPLYRFVLGAGSCGEKSAVGVIMPSVDNVGRYFPFSIVALSDEGTPMAHLLMTQPDWFARLEELALSVLEDTFDLTQFEQRLKQQRLTVHPPDGAAAHPDISQKSGKGPHFFSAGIETTNRLVPAYGHLCNQLLSESMPTYSLWSTNGSSDIAPSLTAYHGLPPATAFTDFISGQLPGNEKAPPAAGRPDAEQEAGAAPSGPGKGEAA